jgi:hypothetical protein
MQSNKILLLDHHTDIFIWSGLEVAGEKYKHEREGLVHYALQKLIVGRFPMPQIMLFKVSTAATRLTPIAGSLFNGSLVPMPIGPVTQRLPRRAIGFISSTRRTNSTRKSETSCQIS